MSVGTSILINRSLAPLISANGIFLESRAQLITLQIPGNENVTIINVYAACSSNERMTMWKRLNETILAGNHFILGGDFNHWEEIEREGVVGKCRMHRREAAAWHHLTLQYGLNGSLTAFGKCLQRNSPLTTKIRRKLGDLTHRQVPRLPRPGFERRENWNGHFDLKILGPFSPSHIHMGPACHT